MIVDTSTLINGAETPANTSVYCGLDCCLTLEILDVLLNGTAPPPNYEFMRSLEGPFLEMQLRGFRIDEQERGRALTRMEERAAWLREWLNELGSALGMPELNPRSQPQLIEALCRRLALPEHWTSDKGQRKLSMNRESLEWYTTYLHARPIVAATLLCRDTYSDVKTLKTTVRNGRWFTSWNIAGTDTGRLSSSKSFDGAGSNLQNITRDSDADSDEEDDLQLRRMFIADDDRVLVSMDRKQSEAREVGFILGLLFDDWKYLDLLESADIHTYVARATWDHLPWTGDPKLDRRIAETPFYRNSTYRDMAKKLAHGSSYLGTPFTMARHAHCSVRFVERFQDRFFGEFPAFPRWHQWVAQRVQIEGTLTNLFGDERQFFDDPFAPETIRKAVAHTPQSSTAKRTNLGVRALWRSGLPIELLAQGHDSITFQCREEDLPSVLPQALALTEIELHASSGRRFVVPGDCKVGWNWGAYDAKANPNGLREWTGALGRTRQSTRCTAKELMEMML